MRRLYSIVILIVFTFYTSCAGARKDDPIEVTSPDGSIKVLVQLKTNGTPYYNVTRKGKQILNDSKLGFLLKDIPSLNKDFKVISARQSSFNETWQQPWGEVKEIKNAYNTVTVELQEQTALKRKLNIIFKVYNDGIGFRYEIPAQPNLKDFIVADELTEFALTRDFTAWWIPAYGDEMDSEWLFRKNKVSELKEKMHTPLTLESDGLYLSFHEAALVDFPAMTLFNAGNATLKCDLIPWANGNKAIATAPMKSPWRSIQIADKPGDLITSYLILNLNDPNKLGDVSWVKPGKYNGMWWGMHMKKFTWEAGPHHGATTKNIKELIDFASEHNLSATLAEGWNEGWEGEWSVDGNFNFAKAYPDYDIAELSRYAKEKNVGLIAHHETGGNVANYERQLEGAFKFLQKYDIHRLKTGYVNKALKEKHQSQFMVRHYQKVLETAARYHVMLDVHEPVKDTGLRRTYPNMMTREGARGTEYEAWSEGNPPSHTTILPFTRCLGGPLDYTPGIFDIQFKTDGNFRVHTTLAKQLALYVVIYSPFQMAADLPENYEGKPAFKFIEDVPTDWEFTKVLNAKIGEYITTVRKDRASNDWDLGSITNENARTLEVKLDFLTSGKKYKAIIYQDGNGADVTTNPFQIEIKTIDVDAASTYAITLAAGGGTAIRFHEVE
jgi:alpha-glucosidase